ncbi:MAG: hypothetical protein WCT26_05140 [Candidatus Buchananbacteria bacterium]|jgi:hypothetical protein
MEFEKKGLTENSEVFKKVGLIVRGQSGVNYAVTVLMPERDIKSLRLNDSPFIIIEAHKRKKMSRQQLEKRVERLNRRNGNIIS